MGFNIPFGQFQWNVMPFRLKNVPFEFQKIMNDIFNKNQDFTIVYIDDVLVFSNTVDQHFKHLQMFFDFIKTNGLMVSLPKLKLFQTKIRFLRYEISQGLIKLIQQSLDFVDKLPDVIQDKTQLQRFLGCVNILETLYKIFIQFVCHFMTYFKKIQKHGQKSIHAQSKQSKPQQKAFHVTPLPN